MKTGTNPDAIVYDPVTKQVFTMNGRSGDATAIDAANGTVAGTLALGGKPEFAVADGQGSIYVNIEDKSELVQFDARKLAVTNRWKLAPCEEPSGLAMDRKGRRLFAGCGNKMMAVINADTGLVITTPAIGEGVDANGFDPGTNLAFASTGEGVLNVVHEDSPNKFTPVGSVPTKKSARTMGLDLKTHNIFLPAADFAQPEPGERRGKMTSGSFVILVVGQQYTLNSTKTCSDQLAYGDRTGQWYIHDMPELSWRKIHRSRAQGLYERLVLRALRKYPYRCDECDFRFFAKRPKVRSASV